MKLLVPKLAEWILSAGLFLLAPASLFLMLSAAEASAQPANLYTFSGDVDLGYSIGPYGGHCIGVRGDTVYVVWSDGTIYCQKSTNGGNSFGPPVQVNSTPTGAHYGMKVDTGGIIYVAFQDFADIYFTKSTDGGQTFTSAIKVNDDTIPQIGQEKPVIAVNNKEQIFIAWRDQRTAPGQPHQAVFASASYDGGQSFTPNVQGNEVGTIMSGGIDIASDDSGRPYIAYRGTTGGLFGIVVARSDDSGEAYNVHALASDLPIDTSPRFAENPSVAVSQGGIVGVSWWDGRYDSVTLRFSVSSDFGQSFSNSIVIDDIFEPKIPSLVFKNGVFYVTWRGYYFIPSDSLWEDQVYFSYSPDTGRSFVSRLGVVQGNPVLRQQSAACLAVNESGKAFVAWSDDRYDLYNDGQNIHPFMSTGVPSVVKGDLNMDGLITLFDVVTELNAVFFGLPFPAHFAAADINCDLKLTLTDMVMILRMYYLSEYFAC